MNIYLEAFGLFSKIGLFTIGGGYAMVPLIEEEIVDKRKWIAKDDFIDLLAISQSTPGILAVNISIFIEYIYFKKSIKCSLFSIGVVVGRPKFSRESILTFISNKTGPHNFGSCFIASSISTFVQTV